MLPIGSIVVPFWGLPSRILNMNHKKGTTMGPVGTRNSKPREFWAVRGPRKTVGSGVERHANTTSPFFGCASFQDSRRA